VINATSAFETTAGDLRFPEVAQGRLLRRPLVECSDMTTESAKFLPYGDIRQAFLIADRVGTQVEILPGFGANQRPSAQRHVFMTFRTGSK
jgi:HK97 family phage major capsid protein